MGDRCSTGRSSGNWKSLVRDAGPESGRIGKLVEQHGPEHPEVTSRITRILAVSRVELVLLIAVVFAMVVKPFA